jgi:hypothetical protein
LSLLLGGGNRSLTLNEDFTVGDGFSGTLTFSASGKTLTIAETSTIDQNLAIAASPSFAGATLGNITIGVEDDNTITTSTGNLVLDSAGGLILAKDNFLAEGAATISGTLVIGNIPVQNTDPNRVLTYNTVTGMVEYLDTSGWDKDGGADVSYFTDLLDTPNNYSDAATMVVRVNAAGDGLEFVDASTVGTNYWGLNNGLVYTLGASPMAATSAATTVGTFTATGTNLAFQAGGTTEFVTIDNGGNLVTTGYLAADSLYIRDTDQSNSLQLLWNEDDSANRTLSLLVSGADRSLTLGADVVISQPLTVNGNFGTTITSEGQANTITFNEAFTIGDGFAGTLTYSASGKTLTIAETSTIDQNLAIAASPTFAGATLGNITIGVADDNTITTSTGILALDSAGGLILAKDNFQAEGAATVSGTLSVGTIDEQSVDSNRVLTYNTVTGLFEYLDTSGWNKNASGDITQDDLFWLQTGEQLYPKNASWLDVLVGGTSTASATIALQAETGNIKASSLNLGTNNLSLSGATIGISTDLDLLTLSNNQLSLAGALQLGAYTPGDTSNKLYQASGSLYWAGEKICVEGGPCASTGTVAYDGTPLTGQVAFFSDESTITGSDQYFWNNTQKLLGVGTNDPDSKLHVTGGYGTNALVILNQDNDGNVISASASGVTVMNLTNTGNLELLSSVSNADRLTFVPYGAGDNPFTGSLTSEDLTTDRTWILPNQGGTIALLSDIEGAVGSINYWDLTNEQLHARNADWIDLLIGGTSTASAAIASRPTRVIS